MFALIAFVLFAILELYVIVLVATAIGVLNTIGLLILFSLLGVWLAKHEGMWVLTRIREQLDAGTMPTNDLIEAGLVLVGGLFLIVPGFITDAIGLRVPLPADARRWPARSCAGGSAFASTATTASRAPTTPTSSTSERRAEARASFGPQELGHDRAVDARRRLGGALQAARPGEPVEPLE